jgi:hypothetical protein
MANELFKDAVLNELAGKGNVAQFVSFGPGMDQRFAWIRAHEPHHRFPSAEAAIDALLRQSPDDTVNVRSYHPENAKSREFLYGLGSVAAAVDAVSSLAGRGLFTIVNETVDVHDGGVSGVVAGDAIEFAPDATPRCVEEPGTAALPRAEGLRLLETVYGVSPALDYPTNVRVEFSLHPVRRGFHHTHTLVWELEPVSYPPLPPEPAWPNHFSRLLGDKVYGLLVAHVFGATVPATTVISRRVAPFRFGADTGTGETWIRTCPMTQEPGRFTTAFGWQDPFALLAAEDPDDTRIASVLAQHAVHGSYSGAFAESDDEPDGWLVEGVAGGGDEFMIGRRAPEAIPADVIGRVTEAAAQVRSRLGSIRGEWVFDGQRCWVVQLHRARAFASRTEVFPGEPAVFREFDVSQGLEALRELIEQARFAGDGIALVGEVGVTSHFGDVLRQAEVPSRIVRPPSSPPDASGGEGDRGLAGRSRAGTG